MYGHSDREVEAAIFWCALTGVKDEDKPPKTPNCIDFIRSGKIEKKRLNAKYCAFMFKGFNESEEAKQMIEPFSGSG